MTPHEIKYLETSIATAPKEELILRVYDALIMLARQAVEKLYKEPGEVEAIHKLLLRCQRACVELINALDFEVGGKLAEDLQLIYTYWYRELVRANMQGDPTKVEAILPDIIEYRKTWAEAIKVWRKSQVPEERSGNEFASIA